MRGENQMSNIIVLFVTRGGHSRALALDLGSRLGAEVHEIIDRVNRKGLFGWIRSGRQAAMKLATPIDDPRVELAAITTLVLVQPVWASAICPPVRTWVKAHAKELVGKRLALLASAYSTDPRVLREAFEAEFGAELGALAACSVVSQTADAAGREQTLRDFISELQAK